MKKAITITILLLWRSILLSYTSHVQYNVVDKKTIRNVKRIINYEIKTRHNIYQHCLEFLNTIIGTIGSFFLMISYQDVPRKKNGCAQENFSQNYEIFTLIVFIIAFIYYGSKLGLDIYQYIVNSNPHRNYYCSPRNSLTKNELKQLIKELNDNLVEDELEDILLRFANTDRLKKRNYMYLDPIRWVESRKIISRTKKNFVNIKSKKNEKKISAIIENYKPTKEDYFASINWLLMILNIFKSIILVSTILWKSGSGDGDTLRYLINKLKISKSKTGIAFFYCITIICPILLSMLEFVQIWIIESRYSEFKENIKL